MSDYLGGIPTPLIAMAGPLDYAATYLACLLLVNGLVSVAGVEPNTAVGIGIGLILAGITARWRLDHPQQPRPASLNRR